MANAFCTISIGKGTNLLIDRVLVTPGSARFRGDISEGKISEPKDIVMEVIEIETERERERGREKGSLKENFLSLS